MPSDGPLGFVGLGSMGLPIARNIAGRGIPLMVRDVDPQRTRALDGAAGVAVAASCAELAAACRRSAVMVADDRQLEQVLFGQDGLAAGARAGDTIACLSTVDPISFRRHHERCAALGIALFDAPVSGGIAGARDAALAVMVGGDRAVSERFDDVFAAIARKVFHVGGVGQGLAMKLVNNLLAQVNMVAICEAYVVGIKAGLDPATIDRVVREGSGNSAMFEARMPRLVRRDFEPGGTLAISHKDQELEVGFARQLGVPVLLASTALQIYTAAMNAGLADRDAISVVRMYERMAGIEPG